MAIDRQRMRLWLRSYDGADQLHAHEFHQIVLPVAGEMTIEVGGLGGAVVADHGVLIPTGTAHRFRAGGENRFVVVDLPSGQRGAAELPEAALRRAAAAPFFPVDPALRHLALYLAHELAEGVVDPRVEHHTAGLLLHALGRAPAPPRPIARAIELIHGRYAEPLTVAELAAAVGLSPSRLHERFREATGRTPAEYLRDIRLDHAENLLRGTDLPIAEIALLTGYSDQTALTRSLRSRRGVTPAVLRRPH